MGWGKESAAGGRIENATQAKALELRVVSCYGRVVACGRRICM